MEITDIKVNKLSGDNGKLRAYARVTIEDALVLTNIAVIEGKYGLFITMPSKKGSDGDYREIFYPLTKEFRNKLQKEILEVYNSDSLEIPKEDITEF